MSRTRNAARDILQKYEQTEAKSNSITTPLTKIRGKPDDEIMNPIEIINNLNNYLSALNNNNNKLNKPNKPISINLISRNNNILKEVNNNP
jgi:hypothetical protein